MERAVRLPVVRRRGRGPRATGRWLAGAGGAAQRSAEPPSREAGVFHAERGVRSGVFTWSWVVVECGCGSHGELMCSRGSGCSRGAGVHGKRVCPWEAGVVQGVDGSRGACVFQGVGVFKGSVCVSGWGCFKGSVCVSGRGWFKGSVCVTVTLTCSCELRVMCGPCKQSHEILPIPPEKNRSFLYYCRVK